MSKINDYIDQPTIFVRDLNKSIDNYIKIKEDETGAAWKERNEIAVSGSVFSQCVRKAWYAYFTPVNDGEYGIDVRKKMYLGHINEEILLAAMKTDPSNIDVTVHSEQNVSPVNVKIEREGVILGSTTDFVLEYPGKIYVPMEVKSTEASDFRPANKWWSEFSGYDAHRRQLIQWMYYSKSLGMTVPFGVLFYSRRANYDTKEIIMMDAIEAPFSPTGDSTIELYSNWESVVESRIDELVRSITSKTMPAFPKDVPDWLCKGCQFRDDCWSQK